MPAPPQDHIKRNERAESTLVQNVNAARAISDAIRTSLGPRGADKMIQDSNGGVVITNDGATILREMRVGHPSAQMLVELAESQDVEAGDGTTSVVIIAGALLKGAEELLGKGIHPQTVSSGFLMALEDALAILDSIKVPLSITDRGELEKAVSTSLQSKVVSSLTTALAPIAVEAVLRILPDPEKADNVNLKAIKVVKQVGGTLEDSELVSGLVLPNTRVSRLAGGPSWCTDAKVGLIQYCLALPKTDMEQGITIRDYSAMDRLLRQERSHIIKLIRGIADTGCNVLLIQKSVLREAVNDLALDFLAKAGILVIRDVEREDVEAVAMTLKCTPVASPDTFTSDKLGRAAKVEEVNRGGSRIVKFSQSDTNQSVSVVLRASNHLTLDEADRSFRDAICVMRCLVKSRALLPGGGAVEIELSNQLQERALSQSGPMQLVYTAFAQALEVIPYTLAENAGSKPVEVVTELQGMHHKGHTRAGVDVKRGDVALDMVALGVVQPLFVTKSALKLATETVVMILKIDDVVMCR